MSKMQRNKGAQFEREIANELSVLLGHKVQRNIGQARDGGDDITLPPYRIECKRRASIAVYQWLDQCAEACHQAEQEFARATGFLGTPVPESEAHIPIVVARADLREPIAIMRWDTFKTFLSKLQGVSDLSPVADILR